jgi:hypothetical protein
MYKKYIVLSVAIILLGATNANAQMFTDIKTPAEQLYELTEPSSKVIKHIKRNLRELITLRLQSEEVGVGEKEAAYFKADIQRIYNEMDEQVHLFWKNNKTEITTLYADYFTPEELIVYTKYLSSPESESIEKKRPIVTDAVDELLQQWVEKHLDKHIEKITNKIIEHQLNNN